MNLKKEMQTVLDTYQGSDLLLFRALKDTLNDYRRSKIKTLTYALKGNYNELAPNRTELSKCIMVKGLSERAIYDRLVRYEKYGFKAKRENKKLTSEICRVLGMERDDLLKEFKQS